MPPRSSAQLPVYDYRDGRGGVLLPGGIPASIPAQDRQWVPGAGGGVGPYRPTYSDARPDGRTPSCVVVVNRGGGQNGQGGGQSGQAWYHGR
jgi:hypothetical protein